MASQRLFAACRLVVLSLLFASLFFVASVAPLGTALPSDAVPYESLPPGVVLETVVPNANQVVAMDFTPDGRLLYTERTGNLQVVANGQPPVTAYPFPVVTEGERGLLGVAVDPNFATNHYVWVYFTKETPSGDCGGIIKNRVVRIKLYDDNSVPEDPVTAGCFPIFQPAPGYYVTIHNGGNLHFGPDGMLYVTVGNSDEANDYTDPAQDLSSPLGKIHRYIPSMPLSSPADNPFFQVPGLVQSIYAYGLRNSFDFTFDPVSKALFATENGDKCDDEINLIRPGYNYGWRPYYPQPPLHPCDDDVGPDPRYNTIKPLIHWTPSIAPTGITFYTGNLIPEWKNDLFMCAFKDSSTALHHFKLDASRTQIISHTILSDTVDHQPIHCRTDVLTGPDGALYFSYGGGYAQYNAPIMRLTRLTSFTSSSVAASPVNVRTGGVFTNTLNISHIGTLSNTFALTATLSPSTTLVSISSGMLTDTGHVYWSGQLIGIQSILGTFAVRVTDPTTLPYVLTTPIEITAPTLPPVYLTSTVIVNGYVEFLPIVRK